MTSPADASSAHCGRKSLSHKAAAREWYTYPHDYPRLNPARKV